MHRENRKGITAVAIALALCLLTSYALAAGAKLSFHPPKGAAAKYSMNVTLKMSGTNRLSDGTTGKVSQNISMSATVRQAVADVTDKGATLTYSFGSAKVTANGKTTDCAKALNDAKLTVTLSPKGVPSGMSGGSGLDEAARQLSGAVLNSTIPLPDKDVAVGEKWVRTVGQSSGLPIKLTCKLAGIEARGGKSVAKITMTIAGSVNNAKQIAQATGPNKPPLTKIVAGGNATYYVEVDTGMMIDATATLEIKSTGAANLTHTETMILKRLGS